MLHICGVDRWICQKWHNRETLFESLDYQSFWGGFDIKRVPDGSFICVFCAKRNKSAFNAHLKLHKHNFLYLPFPEYVLERSLCEWKENIIYMHMPIRPMNLDSRQLASQSRSAESKWKWKLRRIYSVTLTKTKNLRRIIRLQSRLWAETCQLAN